MRKPKLGRPRKPAHKVALMPEAEGLALAAPEFQEIQQGEIKPAPMPRTYLPKRVRKAVLKAGDDYTLAKPALRQLFGLYREKSVAVIAQIATRSRDEKMRFEAAKYILDRTDGPVPREISGKDGAPLIPKPVDDRPRLAMLLGIQMANALGVETTIEGDADDDKLSETNA